MTALYLANLRGLRRAFRLESQRLQLPQGVRAVLAISVPIGLGLALHQLAIAVTVTLGAWIVLITDTGGAYRQKATATLSATVGVACAVLAASVLNVSPLLRIVGTFLWVAAAAFLGVFGNSAATVSFSTSLMFVITAALPHASAIWIRVLLSLAGGLWATCLSLALWPLHAFTPVIQAVARCYETLAGLLEAACSFEDSDSVEENLTKDPFPNRFEAMLVSLETARKIWTAVRVERAGWSVRSSQLLALIENAAQLSSVAVALHEQMLLVRRHPRFADIARECVDEKVELVRVTQGIAAATTRRGGNIDLQGLEQADARLEEAIQRLRSATYTDHDFSILVHIRKLSRCFTSVLELLRTDAEIVANLGTGRLMDSIPAAMGPQRECHSTRILPILRSNFTFESVTFRHAIRLGAAAAIATAIAEAVHLPRGYWVVVTVLVVLKPNFGGTIERVIQRIGGTIVGGVIAMLITIFIPNETMLFLCVALLALISFSIRSFGYGFFTLVLTPLFMVLLDLANPGDWKVSLFRILDTLVGGMLALVGGYTLFPIWERERLPLQLARTLLAIREYFEQTTGAYLGKSVALREIERTKRHAALEVANATTASQRLLSEPAHVRGDIEPTLTAVNYARHLFLAIGAIDEHFHEFPGGEWKEVRAFAEDVSGQMSNLAQVLQSAAELNEFPDLDQYVDQLGENVGRLSAARFEEFSTQRKREVTSTLLALREQSVVHVQLKRIASHLRILQDSVARLKGFQIAPGNGTRKTQKR